MRKEKSCGAVVYKKEHDNLYYLIIKQSKGHVAFPKGHVEPGETNEQTAKREVLEETGIEIELMPSFSRRSEYTIQGKIEKSVIIYLAKTTQIDYKMQVEEIEECGWFTFDDAMRTLNYENDKRILTQAHQYMLDNHI